MLKIFKTLDGPLGKLVSKVSIRGISQQVRNSLKQSAAAVYYHNSLGLESVDPETSSSVSDKYLLQSNGVQSLVNNICLTAGSNVKFNAAIDRREIIQNAIPQMKCLGEGTQDGVLDKIIPGLKYDCPIMPNLKTEVGIPQNIRTNVPIEIPGTVQIEKDTPGIFSPEKQAAVMVTIRKRKMKKHKRQKATARNYAKLQNIKFLKVKKKQRIFNQMLADIKKKGEEFEAFKEIKANLEFARSKGYYVDIFGPDSKSFGFADVLKDKK